MTHDADDQLEELLCAAAEGTLSEADQCRLEELLSSNPELRDLYARYMALHAWLSWERPSDGQGVGGEGSRVRDQLPTPARAVKKAPVSFVRSAAGMLLHPIALLLIAGLISTGILVYKFSTQSQPQSVAEKPAGEPAARVASSTDAQWLGPLRPNDGAIAAGERLVLERGSVEITFSRQARMIIEAPTDVVIVDGGACRLASGKLTAHVPPQAKGFQVHTPDGTVTDLGTEFGVYVRDQAGGDRLEAVGENEQEQPANAAPQQDGKQIPATEVHVFRGQVEFNQALAETNSKSATGTPVIAGHPQFTILQTGQAITISENKVQPLPAADPFKFALDKLQGKPRTVLLSEDFETCPLGNQVKAIGPWIVQSGTRKGQGVGVEDPAVRIAAANATVDPSVRLPAPPTLVGSRVTNFGTSPQNSTDTYPVLGREIDGKLLAKQCQVLVEFDFFPRSDEPQLSLALATDVGHTAGIELWRSVDAAKQGVDAARKIDFVAYRWYRMRVLLNLADGVVGEVRVDRSQWRGPEGWVRDLSYQPPTPKVDWSTPPRYAIFGFPVVSPATVGGVFWLDNVRIEVIAEK